MAVPSPIDARVAELEQQVRELRARVILLERALADRLEHPVDKSAVRSKVTYDWQG
jgi:hypothetical protein